MREHWSAPSAKAQRLVGCGKDTPMTRTHTHTHIVGKGTEGSSVNIIQPRNTSRLLLLCVHVQFKWLLMKGLMVRPSAF